MVLCQPAGLSEEVCVYADAAWLKLSVSQTVARGQLGVGMVYVCMCVCMQTQETRIRNYQKVRCVGVEEGGVGVGGCFF